MNYSIGRFANGIDPVFCIKAAIANDAGFKVKDMGNIHLKKGKFNLIGLPSAHCINVSKKPGERMFSAYYSLRVLEKYVPFFPGLSHFIEVAGCQPLLMFEKNRSLNKKLSSIIYDIMHFSEDDIASQPYIENCLKELIVLAMQEKYTHVTAGYKLTARYIEALKAAKEVIESKNNNNSNIKHLAFFVGLRQSELKTLYKAVFKKEIKHLIGEW